MSFKDRNNYLVSICDVAMETSSLLRSSIVCVFQENPSVVCGAIGLCQSEQAALAELQVQQNEQLLSNEIPKVDLSQNESPFLLNVPLLLYPQNPKDETPKQETPKVHC